MFIIKVLFAVIVILIVMFLFLAVLQIILIILFGDIFENDYQISEWERGE